MSETSHEDEHNQDERLSPKTPDEHSGNQDLQALSHRRQEAEGKLQERQEDVDGGEQSRRAEWSRKEPRNED